MPKLQSIVIFISLFLYTSIPIFSQSSGSAAKSNYVLINPDDTPDEIIRKAASVIPSNRQYEWQKLELTGFIHFGINTFNDVEWGERNTDITRFNPEEINVKQWVKVFKDAGIKLLIITAKHHDGFCLWPSKYTDYNISNTPFQKGKGDIVKDLSAACTEAGLKFGVYLSPWDMHEKTYGTDEYNKHFLNQLQELLTNYGQISEVWFDGANGEGPNGKKQVYDWQAYYKLIRRLQPGAVISIMGPDVRWVGTESGYGRKTEWSVLPGSSADQNNIAESSQQNRLDEAFVPHDLTGEDLGSREKIEKASSLIWYPAEIDVSIRPRWFYHKDDDELVKSPYKLADIYYNSVGLNGVLLLNVPPDKQGLINENDIKSLKGLHYILEETFKENLVQGSDVKASSEQRGNEAELIIDNNPGTYWTAVKDTSPAIINIDLKREETFNRGMLRENIMEGQRIEKFHLDSWDGNNWIKFAEGTTIGYKRLLRFSAVTSRKIRIYIDQSRTNPTLSDFGLYLAPPELSFEPDGGAFADSIYFDLKSDLKNTQIYYSLDGSIPDEHSEKYSDKILLNKTSEVTAVAVSDDGRRSIPVSAEFNKARYKVEYRSGFDKKYPGGGIYSLADGVLGSRNFNDGKWQGYHGSDLDVIIDLGEEKKIKRISARFLRDINSYIFLPQSVEYSVSNNRKDFNQLKKIINDQDQNDKKTAIKEFIESELPDSSVRFVHVRAKNIGVCPDWHTGAGEKAWMFIDEIIIE